MTKCNKKGFCRLTGAWKCDLMVGFGSHSEGHNVGGMEGQVVGVVLIWEITRAILLYTLEIV